MSVLALGDSASSSFVYTEQRLSLPLWIRQAMRPIVAQRRTTYVYPGSRVVASAHVLPNSGEACPSFCGVHACYLSTSHGLSIDVCFGLLLQTGACLKEQSTFAITAQLYVSRANLAPGMYVHRWPPQVTPSMPLSSHRMLPQTKSDQARLVGWCDTSVP